jgi:hypothetical protein
MELALKCFYTNCLSLRNKLLELKQLVIDKTPHFLLLTETWLRDELDGELLIDGYQLYRSDSSRGRVGGVALYISDLLPTPSIVGTNNHLHLADTLWISLPLEGLDRLLLGLVYRSPSSTSTDDGDLLTHLKSTISSYSHSHLLLVGDFNAPKICWGQNISADGGFPDEFFHLVQEQIWTQHVKDFTRYRTGQNPSLLDLILTNEKHYIDTINYLPPLGLSDHLLLQFDFMCYWATSESSRKMRCFPRADFSSLRMHLQEAFSNPLCGTPSGKYEYICKSIRDADEKFIPRVNKRPSGKPPLPRYIRRLLDRRALTFARYKNDGSDATAREFKRVRNDCKMSIRTFFRRKQNQVLEAAKTNKHVLYNFLRRQRKNQPTPFSLHDTEGNTLDNPSVIGNIFLEHFASIYQDIGPTIHPDIAPRLFFEDLKSINFTIQDVERELNSINVFSAMGPDEVHPRILKEGATIFSKPLCDHFREI